VVSGHWSRRSRRQSVPLPHHSELGQGAKAASGRAGALSCALCGRLRVTLSKMVVCKAARAAHKLIGSEDPPRLFRGLSYWSLCQAPSLVLGSSLQLQIKAKTVMLSTLRNHGNIVWHQSNGIGLNPPAEPRRFLISCPAAIVLGTLIPQQSPQ
jgi:hypothetical protein